MNFKLYVAPLILGALASVRQRVRFRSLKYGNFAYFILLPEFLSEICWDERKYFSYFFYIWLGARTLAFRLISQHTTY